ncbi:zf-HC2 domain-containing protein [Mycobacterium sp. CVI_P3]|uniref:Zf-HC2 domain-containing protein n=1 Tax=Mycobacterium pinniadriaticum TaxID=2994102 RepID=A0ABT3SBU9_9MYCO|nr:zf-HC2 domain-containing protein [Mycobacterium pinniadriaticum]MCX2930569.1 zf-HC2 domain-containing protein [Mycobacterium pinniadriaticum]MCX2936993.1 zf-HC2 domain-containing protein [Mycobacterium pinniadriaticum]
MDCDVAREALSARLDGEREPVPAARVDEHLTTCDHCRAWYGQAVEQTQQLRRLAGRSQVAAVGAPTTRQAPSRARRWLPAVGWPRWTLAIIGAAQLLVALAQAVGADVGTAAAGHHAMMGGHLLNESTAWSAALGAVMILAAARPGAAAGLAGVLSVFTVLLTGYVIHDALSGAVSPGRILSHVPVLAGTVLALLVWRDTRVSGPEPRSAAAPGTEDLVLPDNAARGRRRGHLYPTDGSAA